MTKLFVLSPVGEAGETSTELRDRAERLYLDSAKAGLELEVGSDKFRDILRNSDVVVRGVESRTKLRAADVAREYEAWRLTRPNLVYAALTVYGLGGELQRWFGGDLNAQALSGWSAVTGNPHEAPLAETYDISALQHGLSAAGAILAALLDPDAQTRGELIDISEADVLAANLRMYSTSYVGYGIKLERSGSRAPGSSGRYPHTVLPCKDGLIVLICRSDLEWGRLIEMMGTPDWSADERYRDFYAMAVEYPDEVDRLLVEWLQHYSKAELASLALAHRVPLAPVRTVEETLTDVQLSYRGFFVPADGPDGAVLPGLPCHWTAKSE